MREPSRVLAWSGVVVLILSGFAISRADESPAPATDQLPVAHAECVFFQGEPEQYMDRSVRLRSRSGAGNFWLSAATEQVSRMLSYVPPDSRTFSFSQEQQTGSIDSYIFADLKAKGITAAPKTTDWEFIRRVTLDLTGRIPAPDRVLAFVADTTPNKRANLVNELLAKPEWVDKWTMFYGDLFQNTAVKASTGLNPLPTRAQCVLSMDPGFANKQQAV